MESEYIDRKPYFEQFKRKTTHWGEPTHRPKIPNVAYILPPNLQGSMLRLALLRMQIEENAFQMEHQDEESTYSIWRENFIDAKSWFNNVPLAVKEKSREILAREIKTTITAFDQEFPSILKRPSLHPSYHRYHIYKPEDERKESKKLLSKHLDDAKDLMNDNTDQQINDNNNQNNINDYENYDDELMFKKRKSVFDDSDDDSNNI